MLILGPSLLMKCCAWYQRNVIEKQRIKVRESNAQFCPYLYMFVLLFFVVMLRGGYDLYAIIVTLVNVNAQQGPDFETFVGLIKM